MHTRRAASQTANPSLKAPKVFGIGLSRTGGTSLSNALTQLGLSAVHFPADSTTRKEIVNYLDRGGDWLELSILSDYDAISDTPICCVYRGLDAAYPNAKFVLTVRDEASWLRSCQAYWSSNPVTTSRRRGKDVALGAIKRGLGRRVEGSPFDRGVRALATSAIRRHFGQSMDLTAYSLVIEEHLYGGSTYDEARFRDARRSYEDGVRHHFSARPNKLLVLDICGGEGWDKLCPFLGVEPPPEEAFPWTNALIARAF